MCQSVVFTSESEADTASFGHRLAAQLTSGITIALNGELGSGKTQLVRAVCHGLEIDDDQVNSPTFVLLQAYSGGRLPVAHFDTYRLADIDEFLAIGGEDYLLDPDFVCFIEWAERISSVLPADHLRIDITQTGGQQRTLTCHCSGPHSEAIVRNLL